MTPREYLHQAYRLDHKINSNLEEIAALREMACSISSPKLSDRVQTTKVGEASFTGCIEKIVDLEKRINQEIDLLVSLKEEIRSVIKGVENTDEQMVLRYRYIHNMNWEQIGDELHADRTTVYRWHNSALRHVKLPENPIKI